jgi:gliding motility-associated-like protein
LLKTTFFKYLPILSAFLISLNAYAQPANDNCSTAQSLGTLPSPAACPNGLGAAVTVSGTNINATAPAPYTYLLGCGTGGNQPAPALDVWYSFVASGTKVTIVINPGSPALAAPAITLWQGTNCNNLVGVGCDNNGTNAGANTVVFEPLTIGQTYYIQVSGMNSTASGNFNMALNASNDCADCNLASSLTVTPLPTNGTYLPGTQVTFCYTVTNWVQISSNWIHGIIPTFGSGWNIATLQSNGTPPPASQGYSWFWGTGPLGVGWWVDYDPLGPGSYDGNFANNFGYLPTNGIGSWTWCWRITTNSNCASGTNLNMSINTTADGETGNWTSPACLDDPIYNFSAILNCCLPPTLTTTNVLCNGASTGSITATPTSGASPWDFVWTNASGTIVGSTMNVASNTVSNLPAGVYNVTVTDNAGCVSTAQTTITQPLPVSAIATSTPICNGATNGAINLSVTGGTPAYNISWTGPNSGNPAGNEIISAGGNYTIPSLAAGSYSITATDANNCTSSASNSVIEAPIITATESSTAAQCGSTNGTITIIASGGTEPYSVSWSGPSTGNPAGNEIATSGSSYTINGLADGTYTITITDAMGCVHPINSTVAQTSAVAFTVSPSQATCNGATTGSIVVTPSGGSPNYEISWSGPVSGNPMGSEITTAGASYTIPFLSAGNYTVTLTDGNNCSSSMPAVVIEPAALNVTSTPTAALCSGDSNGSIAIGANGGTAAYNISWSGNTSGDPVGNEINTSGGNYTLSNLSSGNYSITTTDANSCSTTLNVTVGPGVSITALLPAINSQCLAGNLFNFSGASATISAGSITSYTWDFGDANPSGNGINTTHSYTTAGTFVVSLTVSNGNCSSTATTSIDVIANPAATASNNSPICAGAILNLNANTLTGATYSWSGPLLYSSLLEDPALTPATTNMSGVYTLTVTLNGCSSTATTTATVSAITDPTINPIASLCINSSPVQLTAASAGGTWSGIGITDSNLGTFNPSIAGAGPAIITYNSAGNCGSSDTQNIVVNPLPIPSFSANNTTGCIPLSTTITNTSVPPGNGCTWWINGIPSGNNCSSLSYTFNSAGCFDIGLSTTDANGCQGTTTIPSFICTSLPPVASFSFTPNNPSVNNTLIQFIDLSLGATSETWTIMDLYNFPVAPVFQFPNESAGEYNVCLLVANNDGCTDLECATVAISDEIIVFVPNCFTPNSDNINELFRPSIRGNSLINTYEFRIFNRWGEVVFFTRDPEEGWIGNTHNGEYFVPDGVYSWQLKIAPKDGLEPFERTGHVTIYR